MTIYRNRAVSTFLVILLTSMLSGCMLAAYGVHNFERRMSPSYAAREIADPTVPKMEANSVDLSWGDQMLPHLRKASKNFTDFHPLILAQVLAHNKSRASDDIARELYARPDFNQRLLGAVALAGHGNLPRKEFGANGIITQAVRRYIKTVKENGDRGEWASPTSAILAIQYMPYPESRKLLEDLLRAPRAYSLVKDYAHAALARLDNLTIAPPLSPPPVTERPKILLRSLFPDPAPLLQKYRHFH